MRGMAKLKFVWPVILSSYLVAVIFSPVIALEKQHLPQAPIVILNFHQNKGFGIHSHDKTTLTKNTFSLLKFFMDL